MDTQELLSENAELSRRVNEADRERDFLNSKIGEVEDELRRRTDELKAAQERAAALHDELDRAKADNRELQLAADDQSRRFKGAGAKGGARNELEVYKAQVKKLLRENGDLSKVNNDLRAAEAKLRGDLEETSRAVVKLDEEDREWRAREAELISRLDEATTRLGTAEADAHDMKLTIAGYLKQFEAMEVTFERNYRMWEEQKNALEQQVQALQTRVKSSRLGGRAGGGPLGQASPPGEGGSDSDSEVSDGGAPETSKRMAEELRKYQEREVLLMEAYEELERSVGREVDAALAEERKRTGEDSLRAKVAREELERERKRTRELSDEVMQAEEKLKAALDRNRLYERGYGLEDAALEIEKWRSDAADRDKALTEVLDRANEYSDRLDELAAENEELRARAGVKPGEVVSAGAARARGREEVAQLRNLVSHLEMELQEREDAEMRLRHELRYRVKWGGREAMKLGLTEEQVVYLETVIDGLKGGSFGTTPEQRALTQLEARSQAMEKTIRRLKQMLTMPEEEKEALLRALLSRPTDLYAAPGPAPQVHYVQAAGAGASADQLRSLEASLMRARNELLSQGADNAHALQHLDGALSAVRAAVSGAGVPGSPAPGGAFAVNVTPAPGPPGGSSPAPTPPRAAPAGAGVAQLRDLFRAQAEELARAHAELAQHRAAADGVREERDRLRARLRGDPGADDGAGFVSLQELREVECEAQSLKRQLVDALEELSVREREAEASAEELARAAETMQSALDQRALLYREYARLREERAAERKRADDAQRRLKDRGTELERELELVSRQLASLKGISRDSPVAEDVVKLEGDLRDRTRALVRAEVASVRMGRQIVMLEASELALKRRNAECEGELREMAAVLRARLDQVTRSRDEFLRRLTAAHAALDASVPRATHVALRDRSVALERRLRLALEERAADPPGDAEAGRLREELAAADRRWGEAARRAARLEETLRQTQAGQAGADLSELVSEELVRARVELEGAGARADRYKREAEAARKALEALEGRLHAVEGDLAARSAELHAEQERGREAAARMESMVPRDQLAVANERVQVAEQNLAEADGRLSRVQQEADEAVAALQKYEIQALASTAELNALRGAVRDMGQQSDADLAVARAAEEIVQLRHVEASLRSQLVRSERDRERLVHSNMALERQLASRTQEAEVLRSRATDASRGAAAAESRLASMRAGAVESHRAERWARSAHDARKRARWMGEAMDALRSQALEWAAEALRLEEEAEAARFARAVRAGPDSEARKEAARVRELLGAERLARSRAERERMVLTQKADYLGRVNGDLEERLEELERRGLDDERELERERAELAGRAEAAAAERDALASECEALRRDAARAEAALREEELRGMLGRRAAGDARDRETGAYEAQMSQQERDAMLEQVNRHQAVRLELEEARAAISELQDVVRAKDDEVRALVEDRDRLGAAVAHARQLAGRRAGDGGGPDASYLRTPERSAADLAPATPARGAGGADLAAAAAEIDRLEGKARDLARERDRLAQERADARDRFDREASQLRRALDRERERAADLEERLRGAEARVRVAGGEGDLSSVPGTPAAPRGTPAAARRGSRGGGHEGLAEAMAVLRAQHEEAVARLNQRAAALQRQLQEKEEANRKLRNERDAARLNPRARQEAARLREDVRKRDELMYKLKLAIKDLERKLADLRKETACESSRPRRRSRASPPLPDAPPRPRDRNRPPLPTPPAPPATAAKIGAMADERITVEGLAKDRMEPYEQRAAEYEQRLRKQGERILEMDRELYAAKEALRLEQHKTERAVAAREAALRQLKSSRPPAAADASLLGGEAPGGAGLGAPDFGASPIRPAAHEAPRAPRALDASGASLGGADRPRRAAAAPARDVSPTARERVLERKNASLQVQLRELRDEVRDLNGRLVAAARGKEKADKENVSPPRKFPDAGRRVAEWEEGKRLQKRIDGLREKLGQARVAEADARAEAEKHQAHAERLAQDVARLHREADELRRRARGAEGGGRARQALEAERARAEELARELRARADELHRAKRSLAETVPAEKHQRARDRVRALENEVARLTRVGEELGAQLEGCEGELGQTRRRLHAAEDALGRAAGQLEREREAAEGARGGAGERARLRVAELESELSARGDEVAHLRDRVREAEEERDRLGERLRAAESARGQLRDPARPPPGAPSEEALRTRVRELEGELGQLQDLVPLRDPEFWEQLEDLKFEHGQYRGLLETHGLLPGGAGDGGP